MPPLFVPNSLYPSGLIPPPLPPGRTLVFFDNFVGTDVDPTIWTKYSGVPGGTNGYWLPSHVVTNNSICNLCLYQDNAVPGGVTGGLNWCGGGIYIQGSAYPGGLTLSPGTHIEMAVRQDPLIYACAIGLMIGDAVGGSGNFPPEIDYFETVPPNNNAVTSFTATAHYGAANSQVQDTITGIDACNWNIWGASWQTTTISYYRNNVQWSTRVNPDQNVGDVNSLVQNMAAGLQIQTPDGGVTNYPPNSPLITAAKPVRMQIDWFRISTGP